MPLSSGTRLGPYEVLSQLGAGGMGEVYRARDTRLERTVAVKVLPQHRASSPEVRQRFEREARTISQLSHPHICALYDVGHQDTPEGTIDYLVMELLEGETLADRLAKGAMPLEQTLKFGVEIAGALGKAHRQGIVHRDLKPANIMLTRSGVKLLDFGLAKTLAAPAGQGPGNAPLTALPTQANLTQEGMILGTFQYMAPEQIEGQEADARTDIFALGTVLYEMATGVRAFVGKSPASLMAAILEREPAPVTALRPQAPPALDRLVRVCLAKHADERWQSADDVGRQLSWIAQAGHDATRKRTSPQRSLMRAGAGLALLLGGGLLGWLVTRSDGTPPLAPSAAAVRGVRRFSILLPPEASLAPPTATPFGYLRPSMAVSPDESRIAYVSARSDGRTQIFMRAVDQNDPTPIAGTEGGFDPFFSPDGEWLGFFTFDSLRKVSLKGGAPLTLAAIVNPVGGAWCDDGTIYVSGDEGNSLWEVAGTGTNGDPPAARIPIRKDLADTASVQCLPGSTGLLMQMSAPPGTSHRIEAGREFDAPLTADNMSIGVLPLPAREPALRPLIARGYAPRYAASGHIVFARGGSLVAVPFDPRSLQVTGSEAAVMSGVLMESVAVPAAQFAITRSGSLLYVPGFDRARTQLVWVDRQGRAQPTAAAPDLFGTLQVAPDGRRGLVELGGLQNDLYVYDLRDGRRIRITSDGKSGRRGIWHPDGRRVVFYSEADHGWAIKQVESDAAPEPLGPVEGDLTSWSAGGLLAGARQRHVWVGSLDHQTTITSSGREWGAVISPDGRLVAYTSGRTGTYQVFAQPVPPTGQEWQVSSDFGEEPIWSRTSRELFFRRHSQWWSVSFDAGTPGPPRLLFQGPYFNASGPSYDVAPDGRFLMALPSAAESTQELRWIENWTDDLKAKLPPTHSR